MNPKLMTQHPQNEAVESLMLEAETDAVRIRKMLAKVVMPLGTEMFPLDLLAFAAVKRHTNTTSAFTTMVRSWNMVIARALLRMHIDTSLRFSAAWCVADPQAFAMKVLKGERIDKIKASSGKFLKDCYLIELHKEEYPWLPSVYKNLSGYIHFSGAHISTTVEKLNIDNREIEFLISDTDFKFQEFSWLEALECFRQTTSILEDFLYGWCITKRMTSEQLSLLRNET